MTILSNTSSYSASACFELHPQGLFFLNCDGTKTRISGSVEVLAIVSDSEATQWGKLIEFTNAKRQKKNLVVPMKLLMYTPRYLAAELSFRGLQIDSSMLCMSLLRKYLNEEQPKKNFVLDYKYDWNKVIFVKQSEMLEVEENCLTNAAGNVFNHSVTSRLESFIKRYRDQFQDLDDKYCLFQRVGYKRKIKGKVLYYVQGRHFRQEITESQAEMKILAKADLLIPDDKGDFCYFVNFPTGKEKVFLVRGKSCRSR